MLGEKRYEYNPLPLVQKRQYLQKTLLISCPESLKDFRLQALSPILLPRI